MAEPVWYWAEGEKQNGPVVGGVIAKLVANGKLGVDDLIWKEGLANWIPISKVPALQKYLNSPAGSAVTSSATAVAAPTANINQITQPLKKQLAAGGLECPHCTASNTAGSQYCEECGMALPRPWTAPRIVDSSTFASTVAGQQLQSEELQKLSKKASGALLAVAVIQTIVGGFLFAVMSAGNRTLTMLNSALIGISVTAVIFWGLFLWSRKQPLPAAIVGLVLYVTLKVVNLVLLVSQSGNGNRQFNGGIGNSGIGWLDIIIIVVLCRAISAGLKYRKMYSGAVDATADAGLDTAV